MPKLKLYCVYTPSHEILLRDWFLPGLPPGFEVIARPIPIAGSGDFQSEDFLRCIAAKVEMIVESIRLNRGEWIVWSDVDILIFWRAVARLQETIERAGDRQLFYQSEWRYRGDVNAGFILLRCTVETERFFEEVGRRLLQHPDKNEQAIENMMIAEGVDIAWDYLPYDFMARSQGWPPRGRLSIYHANSTAGANGVAQKIAQFKELQRYLLPTRIDGLFAGLASRLGLRYRRAGGAS